MIDRPVPRLEPLSFFSPKNEETIVTVFDFFQSFIEYDIPMIAPFVKQLTEMTLEVRVSGLRENAAGLSLILLFFVSS